jgi:YidC/Oxa1 family membrane protein insertase
MTQDKLRHQKALAVMICLFLGYLYVEIIWKPYFFGRPVIIAQQAGSPNDNNANSNAHITDSSGNKVARNPTLNNATQNLEQKNPVDQQLTQAGKVRVHTKDLKIDISLLGGRITKAELLKYKRDLRKKTALDLVEHIEGSPYPLGAVVNGVDDSWVQYQVLSPSSLRQEESGISTIDLRQTEQTTVFLKGTLPDGNIIKKKISFQPTGYLLDISIEVEGTSSQALASYWSKFVTESESSRLDPYKSEGFVWFDGQKALRKTFNELTLDKPLESVGKINWVSVGDKYFATAMLSNSEATISRENNVYLTTITGSPTQLSYQLFLGPKSYDLLKNIGRELQREIDFGKFGIVSAPLLSLLHFFNSIFRNYGLAIVALTILVRLALYPLNSASFKQMKAMQDLKPDLDRIKETVKDKQQQQLALMELYKKKGVNPLGGCLPVLLQMPIFIGLYAALSLAVELRHAHFAAWIDDLSAPEKLMLGSGFGIPVMVILFVLSMMVQQWTTPTTMDPTQKKVMMVMPIVMGFMFVNFPAGLTLYWLTSNLISIGQQKAMYSSDKHGKSPLAITLSVSAAVFALAFIASMF